ncbi:Eukaryotic translation initiation factor isoform 4G-1 [Coccomyxa sp. Obi]|nr:Eukaryotic translation initiation factor isoform 4G-1 [Coccomyxa sp. Obi]
MPLSLDGGLCLRPGGAGPNKNPFAGFGKGAGASLPKKTQEAGPLREERKKAPGDIIKYTDDFLLKFREVYMTVPPEIAGQQELLLDSPGATKPADSAETPLPRQPEQADTRDWHTRKELPPAPENQREQQQQQQQPVQQWTQGEAQPQRQDRPASQRERPQASGAPASQPGPSPAQQSNGPAPKIQRAADVGKTAWMPGSVIGGQEKAARQVKGILNKLTPENFDRLLQQVLDIVTDAEILHSTITLVFENAVAQPTFAFMYAQLCDRLSKGLPEFPPAEGEARPMTFKRVLLNTCQEEFEGAQEAREALKSTPDEDREAAERKVKMRTLGNIRLIAELYKQDVVSEKILHACIQQMLGDGKSDPVEDDVEAMCEMLTIVGKKLEEVTKDKKRLDGYFVILDKWSKNKALSARVKFMIRDIVELRKSKWVPRRQKEEAKKISEIHAAAHAELGMIPAAVLPGLAPLPAHSRAAVPGLADDVELFPAFKGDDDGWETVGRKKGSAKIGDQSHTSAFLGEYTPVAAARSAPAAASAAAAPAPVQPAPRAKKTLTDEERELQAKSLFSEFLSAGDHVEALTLARELAAPGFMPKLVDTGIDALFETIRPKEQEMLTDLLVSLLRRNAYSLDDFITGVKLKTDTLEDLALDVPKAPKLLGSLVGLAIAEGAVPAGKLVEVYEKVEDTETRRRGVAEALLYVKRKVGEAKLGQLCKEGEFHTEKFLAADPEFDAPETSDVAAFLKQEGLSAVPL